MSGLAAVTAIAEFLDDFFRCGWLSAALRAVGTISVFLAAIWLVSVNHKEKDEIEVLRTALATAEAEGLSHAAAEFRGAVASIVAYNANGWTPENVSRFQSEALRFGKSLFDYLNIPEVRVCLYEPGASEKEPEEADSANITALNWVYSTPVPGRHDPSRTIVRSPATRHMFHALESRRPQHNKKRKGARSSEDSSKRWKSSMCMGIKGDNEAFALLTVDSTNERAFGNAAEGILTLLGDLLVFAEAEKDRGLKARVTRKVAGRLELSERR